jgi:hypothetical protein
MDVETAVLASEQSFFSSLLAADVATLGLDQKSVLEGLIRNGSTPQKVEHRCRLLLRARLGRRSPRQGPVL